jgi:hypothetical protein
MTHTCCRSRARYLAAITVIGLGLAGCVTAGSSWSGRELRPADNVPSSFATEDGVMPVQTCRTLLLDPRDNTRIRLLRSATLGTSYQGDYEVPPGRYGVGENELLRIDCETGQVLGIVRNG